MAPFLRSVGGMVQDDRQELGKAGEDLACAELQRRGYAILERRYRSRYGEIDIVAGDRGVTVFVEVKTRLGATFGGGAAAVTPWKQRRVALMAMDYIVRRRLSGRPCRFDVVTVDVSDPGPRVEVYRNAFDAPF